MRLFVKANEKAIFIKMLDIMIKAQEFWDWFKKNEAKFYFLHQIDDDIEKEENLNELEEHLHLYCENLYFEIGGPPNQKQDLIITAQGVADYFDNAEYLVDEAPNLEYWNVIALKPAVEDGVIEYDGIKLKPEKMCFIPLLNENSPKLGLRIYINDYKLADRDKFLFCTYLIVDNLLGERSSALDIGYVEIQTLPPIPERDELIELSKLPNYVQWRKKQATS